MNRFAVLLAASTALAVVSPARAEDASVTLHAGVVTQVIAPSRIGQRGYHRLINVGVSGTAWCSRYDPNPAPNKAGSFPLAPFGDSLGRPSSEEFNRPDLIPQSALFCTADVGTVTLTGEVSGD